MIAAAESLPTEKAYNYFGAMDMRARAGLAFALANDAKWPAHLTQPLKAFKKALGKDGENLLERRNRAIHGVHKASILPETFVLMVPRERGAKREIEISIADLHALVTRLSESAAELGRVFNEYGNWKFGPSRNENIDQAPTAVILTFKQRFQRAIKKIFGN